MNLNSKERKIVQELKKDKEIRFILVPKSVGFMCDYKKGLSISKDDYTEVRLGTVRKLEKEGFLKGSDRFMVQTFKITNKGRKS